MKTTKLHSSRINFYGLVGILLIITVFMTMGARAQAFTWITANQFTVGWDAVTQKADGTPLPLTDTVEYTLYIADTKTDPLKASPIQVYRGPELQAAFTLENEGRYWAGVKAHRMEEDGTELGESIISWSDDVAVVDGDTWGMRYFIPPGKAKGLINKQ